jgi:competence protein ComEA
MGMRSRRPSPAQQAAISRRLALLTAELATVPTESTSPAETEAAPVAADPWQPDDPELAAAFRPWDVADVAPRSGQLSSQSQTSPPLTRAEGIDDWSAPVPGRHAARRPGSLATSMRPAARWPRWALGPGQLTIVATLVALGLGVTAWWAISTRPRSMPPTSAPPIAASVPSETAMVEVDAEQTESTELVVDVAGKVRRPGIAVLPAGARVVDALKAAGGARHGVDLGGLNLARPVVDGEQILVGVPQPSGVGAAAAAPPLGTVTPGPSGALVNINTAGQPELETLPGVGPVTAQAIIAWRTEHDGFGAVEELLDVQGIGEATLAELAPHVTV